MSYVFDLIAEEEKRQNETVELIASENFVSEDIKKAVGSCLTNKYCEGYPADHKSGNKGRYYGGCQVVDKIEEYCCDKWQEVFRTNYHVNVQPHSGTSANIAAFSAVLKPGDKIMSCDIDEGGHISHGSKVSLAGKIYKTCHYHLSEDGTIDYANFFNTIVNEKPDLILVGMSAYSRQINFSAIHMIIQDACKQINFEPLQYTTDGTLVQLKDHIYRPIFMVDMAHIAGLVATGLHPSPFGFADIITTTTHKTLRGPRSALIFCKQEFAKKIDSAVFPGSQGGPLMHVIAGKAICAEEALTDEYFDYMMRVRHNCIAMADEFVKRGMHVVAHGTDTHLLLLDFSKSHPHVTGKMMQEYLENALNITVNKNMIPGDKRSPKETSGIRLGTAAMTTKGYLDKDFIAIADKIVDAANILEEKYGMS